MVFAIKNDRQPTRLKKNLTKLWLDQESNSDLSDDRTQFLFPVELIRQTGERLIIVSLSYSETPLIRSPKGPKNLAVLTGWPYDRGRLEFHDLKAAMTSTPYITFAFLEQLFALIYNRNEGIAYSSWKNYLKIFILKFSYKIATSAPYVYFVEKIVQEQAQNIRSINLTCHRHTFILFY